MPRLSRRDAISVTLESPTEPGPHGGSDRGEAAGLQSAAKEPQKRTRSDTGVALVRIAQCGDTLLAREGETG